MGQLTKARASLSKGLPTWEKDFKCVVGVCSSNSLQLSEENRGWHFNCGQRYRHERALSKDKAGQKKALFKCLYTSVCSQGDKQWEAEVFV